MRICELLSTRIQDINLRERKILIFESAKNRIGRVVYLSEDARVALRKWIKIRNQKTDYLFYGHRGRPLSYEAARSVFKKYSDKADLSQKRYTLHCLRHTFASELLSAGMPLESLQYLMGHSSIVVTRRYARLTNIALEKDYFVAMQKIERGKQMDSMEMILKFSTFMKRRSYSRCTIKTYTSNIKNFCEWLDVRIDKVTSEVVYEYLGFVHNRRLNPKSINCILTGLRKFYDFLYYEEKIKIINPVKPEYRQREPKPLPRFLRDKEIEILIDSIKSKRDRAMCMLMLRCGLRAGEVAKLTLRAIDFERRRIFVLNGKGPKDRIVYFSDDTYKAIKDYLKVRPSTCVKRLFLVEKGLYKGKPISLRGIQKRIEYYAKKAGLPATCHRLRHTMATQLLNADAMLVSVQELLGHNNIISTQRYCKVSNEKVRRDYFKAMALVMMKNLNA
jgi:site-specific recombinase XerD